MTYKDEIYSLYEEFPYIDDSLVSKHDKKNKSEVTSFIIELLNLNMDYAFTIELFLSNPFLWADFNRDDWINILRDTKRIKSFKSLFDHHSFLADFIFMHRFLQVDPIDLYLSIEEINGETKLNTLKSLKFVRYQMCFSKSDQVYFDEGLIQNQAIFKATSQKLKDQGLKNSASTVKILENQISKSISKIGNPV